MEAGHHRKKERIRPRSLGLLFVARDVMLLIVAVMVFALFHHVLPRKSTPAEGNSVVTGAECISPSALQPDAVANVSAPEAAAASAATHASGDFSAAFPAGDTGKEALYSYQTDTVKIAVDRIQADGVTCFLADVYIKNIEAFETALAKGAFKKGSADFPARTATANGAKFAVTGDNCSVRSKGVVVRNGILYRDAPSNDVCALFLNGEMKTYTDESLDLTDFSAQHIWQTWSCGPALLTASGEKISSFPSDSGKRDARCGVGYYSPGHYCFILAEGPRKGYSLGLRLSEFSMLFASLGCKQAYNLAGGAAAMMVFQGEIISKPCRNGRKSGDIIYFR